MANMLSIARPYAFAAFQAAQENQQLADWKLFLASAASIAQDKNVKALLTNPLVESSKLLALFEDVLGSLINPARKNFLMLLAENNRLIALPDISTAFDDHYATLEKTSNVRVITAIKIKINSPANMLPNSRNARETGFAHSSITRKPMLRGNK